MILAEQIPTVAIVLGIAVFVGLGAFALLLFRGYERLAQRSLARRYAGLEIHDEPQDGDVLVTYHTYHGCLAWFTQTPHRFAGRPDEARKLLGRLLRFNLTWGLTSAGAFFVPILAIANYVGQRRSIAEQGESGRGIRQDPLETAAEAVEPIASASSMPSPAASPFHRFVGWIAAGLCGTFAIFVVVSLVRGEYEVAVGGVVFSALLGWVARDWLAQR